MLTYKQIAELFGVCYGTVIGWVRQGLLIPDGWRRYGKWARMRFVSEKEIKRFQAVYYHLDVPYTKKGRIPK